MTSIPDDIMREARLNLIREAIRFASWAAGEGICPIDGEPAESPEDFLFEYSSLTGDEDWDNFSDRVLDEALAAERTRTQKETAERCMEICFSYADQQDKTVKANAVARAIRAALLEGKEG